MTSDEQMAKNAAANEAVALREFPNEIWIYAENIKLNYVEVPINADGIIVAVSRLPINQQEELDFIKEIKSAIILKKHEAAVTLIPRIKRPDGKGFLPGPDAIVNGLFFEFKEVVGSKDKIGDRFKDSRKQGKNVYIRVANPNLTKSKVLQYLTRYLNLPTYKGGYKGNLILTFYTGLEEKTYFLKIANLKKK